MLAIQLSTLLPIALTVIGAFVLGYIIRSSQVKWARRRIIELEKEMLHNHAEILELLKERASLLRQMKESKIPVIPIKSARDEDRRYIK